MACSTRAGHGSFLCCFLKYFTSSIFNQHFCHLSLKSDSRSGVSEAVLQAAVASSSGYSVTNSKLWLSALFCGVCMLSHSGYSTGVNGCRSVCVSPAIDREPVLHDPVQEKLIIASLNRRDTVFTGWDLACPATDDNKPSVNVHRLLYHSRLQISQCFIRDMGRAGAGSPRGCQAVYKVLDTLACVSICVRACVRWEGRN